MSELFLILHCRSSEAAGGGDGGDEGCEDGDDDVKDSFDGSFGRFFHRLKTHPLTPPVREGSGCARWGFRVIFLMFDLKRFVRFLLRSGTRYQIACGPSARRATPYR